MATVVGIGLVYRASEEVAVLRAGMISSETITSSASSQKSTETCQDNKAFWEITTKDGAIWAVFSAAGATAAVAGTGHLIPPGQTRIFNGVVGHQVCVIDA